MGLRFLGIKWRRPTILTSEFLAQAQRQYLGRLKKREASSAQAKVKSTTQDPCSGSPSLCEGLDVDAAPRAPALAAATWCDGRRAPGAFVSSQPGRQTFGTGATT